MIHLSRFFLFLLLALFSSQSIGQSQEQIRQFAAMSPQQQELIARQLGISVEQLRQRASNGSTQSRVRQPSVSYPRGTAFDELAKPVIQQDFEVKLEDEERLSLFGVELFENGPSTFTPQLNGDVPAQYRIGTGEFSHTKPEE